jgi:hypothetical protein
MKPMALFGATYSGCSLMNSGLTNLGLADGGQKNNICAPLVVDQRVSMVARNSYMVIVKPETRVNIYQIEERKGRECRCTVNFVLVFHEQERIKVDVAMEMDIGSVAVEYGN